nr:MAG TPA: hypothetical protein [Caudoviricetes sp.]
MTFSKKQRYVFLISRKLELMDRNCQVYSVGKLCFLIK